MSLPLSVVQTAQNAAIRTVINMGVFEAIPASGGSISATDLSTKLECDIGLVRVVGSLSSTFIERE